MIRKFLIGAALLIIAAVCAHNLGLDVVSFDDEEPATATTNYKATT